jgi:UDP-N-acetylglucosamine 2-epimerase (non-hydrolysing)
LKISIILGTRPEIVKMSPIIRRCEKMGLDYFVLHTGQHYTYSMDKIFFEQLELPDPKYNLNVGSNNHGKQTGLMLGLIEDVLLKEMPDIVLVEGDTNTVLAGAISAAKLKIKVGHVEAGLRSYDRSMPEEINRILADHCSDYLFAPTQKSKQTLQSEGFNEDQVFMVGNTVVDALCQNLELAQEKASILKQLNLSNKQFLLVTIHRQENVDGKGRFSGIIKGLQLVQKQYGIPVIYPIHPRAKKQLERFNLSTDGLTLLEPLDYLAFLQLESQAKLILTDSGGVQEEACIMGVPCVTLRDNTERPETIEVGANRLAGTEPKKILQATKDSCIGEKTWVNPFGDGKTAERIIKILRDKLK